MVDGMSEVDRTEYGTIVVVGGGCYGSYYVRQLNRARDVGALRFERVLVVDRDPACAVAMDGGAEAVGELVVAEWTDFFADYLAALPPDTRDAIVPSPLMPHLLYQWLEGRARERWPDRHVATIALGDDVTVQVPWQRQAPDGTRYVSYATWMCPVNCIEPAKCPHTRGPRDWTMPAAVASLADAERAHGRGVAGPVIFHCTHRAYGVGMIDCRAVVAGDDVVRAAGTGGPTRVLVGTVSHCHGALSVLSIE
jgi:hypothetical protein